MTKQQAPVAKNEYYDVVFTDLTHDGLGVAKVDGFPLFVKKRASRGAGERKSRQSEKTATGTAGLSSCTNRAPTASRPP